jgi:chromosome segregation ATPase
MVTFKELGVKEDDVGELRRDVLRLKRVIELREVRLETLTEDLRAAREDRDRYSQEMVKIREELGNLLSAIEEWKKKSGLY